MMREISASLYGAIRLAQFDSGGLRFFNTTVAGFRRSFVAAGLVAPLFAVLLFVRYLTQPNPPDAFRYAAIESIAYAIAA